VERLVPIHHQTVVADCRSGLPSLFEQVILVAGLVDSVERRAEGLAPERLTDLGRAIGRMVVKDQDAPADRLDGPHNTLNPPRFVLDPEKADNHGGTGKMPWRASLWRGFNTAGES